MNKVFFYEELLGRFSGGIAYGNGNGPRRGYERRRRDENQTGF